MAHKQVNYCKCQHQLVNIPINKIFVSVKPQNTRDKKNYIKIHHALQALHQNLLLDCRQTSHIYLESPLW